jgi:hypothetical protein
VWEKKKSKMNFIKFPEIEQFRHVIDDITRSSRYRGKDDNGKPIYDEKAPLPTITFRGTVKLHGTNAGVCYNKVKGVWAQSRNRVISVGDDNAGFATFVKPLEAVFTALAQSVKCDFDGGDTVAIFGEWCGQGIMKNVGICKLPKMFVVFAALISPKTDKGHRWLIEAELVPLKSPENKVFNIYDYETFSIDIDFSKPELSQPQLTALTDQVERQCPVAMKHGKEGIGKRIIV